MVRPAVAATEELILHHKNPNFQLLGTFSEQTKTKSIKSVCVCDCVDETK